MTPLLVNIAAVCSLLAMPLVLTSVASAPAASDSSVMDLLMPGVSPKQEDTYLCTAVKLDKNRYIRAFNPQHQSGHAHHIILTACKEPGSATEKVWSCGEMLTKSEGATGGKTYKQAPQCASDTRIIYAYAMDAPALQLPDGVTFGVGPGFDLPWLVVQVHYKKASDFVKNPSLKDNSGVKMTYQTTPSPKLGGVHISLTDGVIPAHSVTHMETSCSYDGQTTLHPFAFRTHTHSHGRVVSGYRVRDGHWSLIGSANPQMPQMFYPVNGSGVIRPGDMLAAKCVMENTGDKDVSIGATQKDEMCNFYMMYWIRADDVGKDGSRMCYTSGELWDLAPSSVMAASATVPGTERVFREMNREMDRMDRMMNQMLLNGERAASGIDMPGFEDEANEFYADQPEDFIEF
ncbi:hypothetical protein BOX15_Mlig014389g3 [Macrostomum lignano]|uniref:Uncharacterized protein n=2 Tax=Macrostomum lignano TaxID=282301 RepID=A0A267FNK9_9PLAT|nr:hypothetical protein BOX15_Mlig014389g3 [Macrostomum lignano]